MKHLIAKAKRLFLRLSVREKLLSLLFLLVILFLWGSNWMNRTSNWNQSRNLAQTELTTQEQWLERSHFYTEGLARALERVDPSRTYSATHLSGRIDAMLREAGLAGSADINPVRTREGEIFNDHNLRVRLSRISLGQLIDLNQLFSRETPYINLEGVRLSKNARNPEQLDVRLEINSFELKESTLEN